MSFGRPPSFTTFSAPPPDRGSFPLDHDGECTVFMKEYLNCLKENQNNNGKCRHISKQYLSCRMDKGLMGSDDFKNLGFHDNDTPSTNSNTPTPNHSDASTTKEASSTSSQGPSSASAAGKS
ncbi:Cytochrome c oxidase assembly protein cox19 [Linnemannia gamsii]|uniref:Cytochrome c oxidase assembly protein COX19 n=1 Tax=Linnemannia gamsii TaxID=64522 RepID=A0A9P6QW65_9FUNG|nr:Cytochrome c oxidase assembly protein cox19 [Linnemannia gamsii]